MGEVSDRITPDQVLVVLDKLGEGRHVIFGTQAVEKRGQCITLHDFFSTSEGRIDRTGALHDGADLLHSRIMRPHTRRLEARAFKYA